MNITEHSRYYSQDQDSGDGQAIKSPEIDYLPEVEVTPEMLLEANLISQDAVHRWSQGIKILQKRCGDARYYDLFPEDTIQLASIGAAEVTDPYSDLFGHSRVSSILLNPHFSGPKSPRGHVLRGCGGYEAKRAHITLGSKALPPDIADYVNHQPRFRHPDAYVNTVMNGQELAQNYHKPVLVAFQDHYSGLQIPVAAFWNDGWSSMKAPKLRSTTAGNYNPSELYNEGIAGLRLRDLDELPDEFEQLRRFVTKHNEALLPIHLDDPRLKERQLVQNPHTMVLGDSLVSPSTAYKPVFGKANSHFNLHLPRYKANGHVIITDGGFQTAIQQASYGVGQCIENHGEPNNDFSRLNTIFVVTESRDESLRRARQARRAPFVQRWLDIDPQHQILFAEQVHGKATMIDKLDHRRAA